MSKNFFYIASEHSVDVRSWTIESDRKLTAEQVTEIYQDSQIDNEGKKQKYSKGIFVTFDGTEFGDDAIPEVEGDFAKEKA